MNLTRLLLGLALGRRLPVLAGELRVSGPTSAATIRRDRFGIPHIDAANEGDAIFALGFCQGQDRSGQLEFLLRVARGQLAEWVGPKALAVDSVSRRIGFYRAAEAQLPVQDEGIRKQLSAFAAGVSAGSTVGLTEKPHEFAILGGTPTPWQAVDVLAVLKLQSFVLPSNWDVELARLRLILADGPEAVIDLDPSIPEAMAETGALAHLAHVAAVLTEDLAALLRYLPRGGGSNNWVISGSRTVTKKPILASDPHLAPTAPPPWYLSHIRCPDWEAAGASLSGSPGYAIGHNGFAAWGVTAGLTDNTDLYIETLGSDRRSVRQADGAFAPCEVIRETIRVRGQADVIEDVIVTSRGPIISTLDADTAHAISLQAVWLEPLPIEGFLGVARTRSFDEFRTCFDRWPILPLNVAYADSSGDTSWFLIGQLPRRTGGAGLVPRPADQAGTGWTGLIPFDEMPCVKNPEAGYWATANNDPAASVPGPHPWLGADYCDPYRVRTIREALAARDLWSVDDCLSLQQELRSIPWEEMRSIVLSLIPTDSDARDGLALLRDWNGRVEADSPAAGVFELFVADMCVRVARARAPKSWPFALGESALWPGSYNLFSDRRVAHLVRLFREQPEGWFPSWSSEMLDSLSGIVRKLRTEVGPAPAYWAWGHLRQLRLDHPLFGGHRWLGPAFNLGPFPCGGDCNTVSQAGARPSNPTDYTHNMANLRTVFDLSDLSRSRFVLCGGQSGNPWSPHFADQFPLWQAGESIVMPWEQAAVIRESKHTLRLLPD